jgi:hypothetical protein
MPRHRERDLYPGITEALRERGLEVAELMTMRAGCEGTMTMDHVAWRWEGEEIRLYAVETKTGVGLREAGAALDQAIAYQHGIPFVYICAEAALEELSRLRPMLEARALG